MIARHWRGWTKAADGDLYETLLREKVLPGMREIKGYRGGYVLRKDGDGEAEFVVVNLFESLEAVMSFAGPDYDVAVFEPEARLLLCRIEPTATHYDVRACTV
jgi:heme-degrading monooxygenase HmoA